MAADIFELLAKVKLDTTAFEIALATLSKKAKTTIENNINTWSESLNKLGSGITKTGQKVTNIGKNLSIVSAGITAIVGAAFAKSKSFIGTYESAMTVFTRKLQGGEQAALNMYNELVRIAKGSAYAQEYMVSAGQTLVAMGVDAKTTSKYVQIATNAIAGMGGSGSEIQQMTELFGKLSQQTTLYSQDLNQMVTAGIPAWDILATKYHTTTDAVKDMAHSGLLPATESLETITDALTESNEASEMYKYSMDGLAQSLKNGTLTGTLDSLNTNFRTFALRLLDLDPRTESGKENIEKLNRALSSFGNVIETIGGKFSSVGSNIATKLEKITNFLTGFNNALGAMPKPMADLIVKLITAIATAGPALLIAGQAIKFIGSAVSGLGLAIKTVQASINMVSDAISLLASPTGWIIIAIGLLVAAIVWLWNNCEEFRNFMTNLWDGIVTAWNSTIEWIKKLFTETIPNIFNSVIDWVKNNWQGLLLFIANPIAGAFKLIYDNCDGFREFINTFGEKVKEFFVNMWNGIVTFFTETIPKFFTETIPAWFISLWETITNFFSNLPYYIGYVLGYVVGTVAKFIVDVITFFSELPGKIAEWLLNVVNKIKEWAINVWNYLSEEVPKWINSIVTFFSELPGKIAEWITKVYNKIAEWVVSVWDYLKTEVPKWINSIVTFFSELPGKIAEWLLKVINKIKDWGVDLAKKGLEAAQKLFNSILDTIKELPDKIKEIGSNLVKGIWNGITGMGNWIKEKITGFASGLLDGFKKAFGIHSPSTLMRDMIGKNLALGVAEGWSEEIDGIKKDMTDDLNMNGVIEGQYTSTLINPYQNDEIYSTTNPTDVLSKLFDVVALYLPDLAQRKMVLDTGAMVGELSPYFDERLGTISMLKERGN